MTNIHTLELLNETYINVFKAANGNVTDNVIKFIRNNRFFNFRNGFLKDDINKYTLLHISTLNENYRLIKFLLDNEADMNQNDSYGKSAFDIAIASNKKEIIKLFLNKLLKKNTDDIKFYKNNYDRDKRMIKELENVNDSLLNNNKTITKNLNQEKAKNKSLENSLFLERKRKRDSEEKCIVLENSNKRLKKSVTNLTESLMKR